MEFDPNNSDVFHLLEKLKAANGAYPPELLALRRQGYLRQVAEISGAAGLALALKTTAKSAKSVAVPSAATSLLEGILLVAIIVEASAVTYFYRDKIRELYLGITGSPKVEEVANPPVLPSLIPGLEITPTPASVTQANFVTNTATAFITPTPSPALAEQATQSTTNQTSQGTQDQGGGSPAVSTPAVDGGNDNTNNGNHYGSTAIPERTKEPGNNDNDTSTTSDHPRPRGHP